VSDNINHPSFARKAGQGLAKALRGIFGPRLLGKTRDSWRVLKAEYRKGRAGDEPAETPVKVIPYRESDPDEEDATDSS